MERVCTKNSIEVPSLESKPRFNLNTHARRRVLLAPGFMNTRVYWLLN